MRDQTLRKHFDLYQASLEERRPEIITWFELEKAVPQEAPSAEIFDALVQKALVVLLKQKLDVEPRSTSASRPRRRCRCGISCSPALA
jgi:hypothetical protein